MLRYSQKIEALKADADEGAIVGAGSVTTKDIARWTTVAGNPARMIREIPE